MTTEHFDKLAIFLHLFHNPGKNDNQQLTNITVTVNNTSHANLILVASLAQSRYVVCVVAKLDKKQCSKEWLKMQHMKQ